MNLSRIMSMLIIVLVMSFFCGQAFAAAGPARIEFETAKSTRLTLTVGKSFIIESREPVKRISISSPEIADAMVLTPWQIYLTGKSPGLTNLTLWSNSNKSYSAIFDIEVMPDTVRLKEKIHEILPREENVKVTSTHDGITLTGTVSNASAVSQVMALAQTYAPRDKDNKPKVYNFLEVGGVHQVMLEVRVSEMSRSTMKRLGFNWSYISDSGRQFGISMLDNLTRLTNPVTQLTPVGGLGNSLAVTDNVGMIFRFLGGGATWTVFIDALKENGLTKILAEPTLLTLSGQTANFLAGGEYPIPVPQATGTATTITIEYKPFGVGLKFTPTVLDSGKISMQVAPEVSELDFSKAIALQGYIIPSLNTRRVSTTVELADGQSFAIAGLLRDDVREIVKKFPLLGDLPILGSLFRSSSFQKNESELVVIVTPHLVKPLDLKKQTLPTDQYVEPNDFEFYLLGATEGEGRGKEEKASGTSFLKKGGGLEGDFGYILN